jgi:hypothetical protein
MTTTIYRPDGAIGQARATLAPSPASLTGARIAVLDNGKPRRGTSTTSGTRPRS